MADLDRALLEELKSISADENALAAEQQGMVNAIQIGTPPQEATIPKAPKEGTPPDPKLPGPGGKELSE